ncbi:MAG: hypothetical protein KDF24_14955 [Rhodocyclaceae bacterium]|nr:hypothetical protein [Rhodocyclaceae bacterium]
MATKKKTDASRQGKRSRNDKIARRKRALTAACERLLQCSVASVDYPGGRNRESLRMVLDNGETVIATRRNAAHLASVEVRTLRALNAHRAPAPALLATDNDRILLQEALRGQRLSLALKTADEAQAERLLSSALTGLHLAQRAASAEGLERYVAALGTDDAWINALIDRPRIIGDYLGVAAPAFDRAAVCRQLSVPAPRFVKWDARPGNAYVVADGTVFWFDWEHAGKRNALDDMAWLLGDEYVPDYPAMEQRLIDTFAGQFADALDADAARAYLYTYGSFHMVVRLALILKYKADDWWDLDYCIDRDKVGITLLCAQRICLRGARWSGRSPHLAALAPWFRALGERIERL